MVFKKKQELAGYYGDRRKSDTGNIKKGFNGYYSEI